MFLKQIVVGKDVGVEVGRVEGREEGLEVGVRVGGLGAVRMGVSATNFEELLGAVAGKLKVIRERQN